MKARFDQVPNAKVRLTSFKQMKEYLSANVRESHGLPVVRWRIKACSVEVELKTPDGSLLWVFYGYIDDVAHNIQLGLLEPEVQTDGR